MTSTVAAGERRRPGGRCGRRPSASESRMQRDGLGRRRRAGRPAAAAIRSGMPPGGMKAGSSTSMRGPPAGQPRRPRRGGRRGRPRCHVAQALLEQPEPADVAQEAGAAVDADLVGEVGRAGRLGEDRARRARGRRATRCRWRCRRSGRSVAGHADDRRGGVVRADRRHRSVPSVGRAHGPSPGGSIGRQQVGGDAEPVEEVGRPLPGADVEQAGGRRVGQLGPQLAGEPVGEEVGEQHDVGGLGPRAGPRCSAASW